MTFDLKSLRSLFSGKGPCETMFHIVVIPGKKNFNGTLSLILEIQIHGSSMKCPCNKRMSEQEKYPNRLLFWKCFNISLFLESLSQNNYHCFTVEIKVLMIWKYFFFINIWCQSIIDVIDFNICSFHSPVWNCKGDWLLTSSTKNIDLWWMK